jgi:hypothetical protein
MYKHVDEVMARRKGKPYKENFQNGIPLDLKLPNGTPVFEVARL